MLFFPMKGTIDYDLRGLRIPLLKGIVLMCVDVRDYTIRITNLDGVDQSILLYVVIALFHFEPRLHNVGAVCSKEKQKSN